MIRKGSNRIRKIRHRSACDKTGYVLAPAIRLFCNECQCGFVWQYWIEECFPEAIRIADRFHVHRYVVEAVQAVRKTVQSTLSPGAKANLKSQASAAQPTGGIAAC